MPSRGTVEVLRRLSGSSDEVSASLETLQHLHAAAISAVLPAELRPGPRGGQRL